MPFQPAIAQNRFNTTRWSIVLSSAAGDANGGSNQKALSHLCRMYWPPIFAFVVRRGYSITDAQDLTQDFFVSVLEGTLLQRADPSRGRFRSLLLKALQNFLIDAYDKRSARKRGGANSFVSWDSWVAETPSPLTVPAALLGSWTPECLFDIRWAATVAGQALSRLKEECNTAGRRRVFATLSGSLTGGQSEASYAEFAEDLGLTSSAVKQLLYQLRRRYRDLLREEVARTVENEADINEEIRYLCAALAAGAK